MSSNNYKIQTVFFKYRVPLKKRDKFKIENRPDCSYNLSVNLRRDDHSFVIALKQAKQEILYLAIHGQSFLENQKDLLELKLFKGCKLKCISRTF